MILPHSDYLGKTLDHELSNANHAAELLYDDLSWEGVSHGWTESARIIDRTRRIQ
jgi:hypothetical protein